MSKRDEMKARDLISRAATALQLASTGCDDIGVRSARLLQSFWKPKPGLGGSTSSTSITGSPGNWSGATANIAVDSGKSPRLQSHGTTGGTDPIATFSTISSPANDFPWLDWEPVGQYTYGEPGNPDILLRGYDAAQFCQVPAWSDDLPTIFWP